MPYTASGFAACGKLFNSLFGVDYLTAMIISAIVIVAYTTLGGFLAASTSDFIQSIIMSIALVIVLSYGIISVGGFDGVVAHVGDLKGFLSITSTHDGATNTATPYSVLSIETATDIEITTQTLATRLESFNFFVSSIAINLKRICGMPKYPSPQASVEAIERTL